MRRIFTEWIMRFKQYYRNGCGRMIKYRITKRKKDLYEYKRVTDMANV